MLKKSGNESIFQLLPGMFLSKPHCTITSRQPANIWKCSSLNKRKLWCIKYKYWHLTTLIKIDKLQEVESLCPICLILWNLGRSFEKTTAKNSENVQWVCYSSANLWDCIVIDHNLISVHTCRLQHFLQYDHSMWCNFLRKTKWGERKHPEYK